jgi:hypothetical protein
VWTLPTPLSALDHSASVVGFVKIDVAVCSGGFELGGLAHVSHALP